MDNLTLFNITVTLFLIMDPLGNASAFLKMMQHLPPKRLKLVVIREMLIALAFMFLFNYFGNHLFKYLGLTEISVRLTSGVILFLVALKIIFSTKDSLRGNIPEEEPFVVPLAVPLIAGPALLATILLYSHMETCEPMMLTAIVLAWICSSVVLLLSPKLYKIFGKNGLVAIERLLAMVLVMIAIQRFLEGVQQFVHARG